MFGSGFLTRYQPNFCVECGAKLLRLHWYLWTNRRFCNDCARRLRRQRLAAAALVILTLLGTGFLLGRGRRPTAPPLLIERRADSPLPDGDQAKAAKVAAATESPAEIVEDISICGAKTK